MLAKRLIACLDVRDGCVVKGVNFEGLRNAGDPAALARRYNAEGIDELVVLDVTATIEGRRALARHDRGRSRRSCSFRSPSAAASGRRTDAARRSTRAPTRSASTAPRSPIRPCSRGWPAATAARRWSSRSTRNARDDGWQVFARSGGRRTTREAVEWAREAEARGAGEILLTSIDRDGTRVGFDCELTAAVARRCRSR